MEKKIRIDVEIAGAVENLEKVNAAFEEIEGSAKTTSKSMTDGVKQQGDAIVQQNAKIQKALQEEVGAFSLLRKEMQETNKNAKIRLTNLQEEIQFMSELKKKRATVFDKKQIIEYDKAIFDSGQKIKAMGGSFNELKAVALMSLGEMKQELRSLRKESFTGMADSEIAAVRTRMAELTDAIGDFQGQIRSASADAIPAMVAGFQGIISGVQLVTGAMQLFGVENEKLQKSIIALMSVSQAMSQIQNAVEMGHFKNARAALVNTAAKIKLTIASTGLGKAMMALPLGWVIAGIAAITAGVVLLVKAFQRKNSALEDLAEKYEETFDEGVKLVAQMNIHATAVKTAERGTRDYTIAVKRYNEMAKEQKLLMIGLNDSLGEQNRIMRENNKLILARVAMQAAEEELVELMKLKYHYIMAINTADDEGAAILRGQVANIDSQIKSLMSLNGQLISWTTGMDAVIANQAESNDRLHDMINATDDAVKETTKLTTATDKQKTTTRQATNEQIALMRSITDTTAAQKELDAILTKMTLIPIKQKTQWTEYYQSQQDMSRETALRIINDMNQTAESKQAAIARLIELDNQEYQNKIDKIRMYEDIASNVGNTIMAMSDAIASGAEKGSEREKKARKAAALAALAVSTANAGASIAEGIINAQKLPPPANIAEAIRITAVGITQIANIIKAKNEISKLAKGGRGEFNGASHAKGGIHWNGHEVEGGEKWYVLSKNHSKQYGHIMDTVFDKIKSGNINTSPVYSPNINLNDKYTKGMYELMKQPQESNMAHYTETRQGNRTKRIYR